MGKVFLYQIIVEGISNQIRTGVLKAGDRLPSVRQLCLDKGVSLNTAKRVFQELEAQSLIYSKPQSGYYVSQQPNLLLPLSTTSRPTSIANSNEPNELISKVYTNMGKDDLTLFALSVPSPELLPVSKLKKELAYTHRTLIDGGITYAALQGNLKLRQMVAQRSLTWGGHLQEDDLITTNGGMNALALSLMALGKTGDTIAVESPCYPGILQLAISLGMHVLELPTHPTTGIEIHTLKRMIPQINLCLLVSNFNTPLGSCMPDSHKKEVVELFASNNIPLIEDDVYGDLFFGSQRPNCCKSFDMDGNVVWCSSISKTLAPGFRVGWIAPGKHKDKLLKMKLIHSISSSQVMEETVANFMKNGRYDYHLRQLRQTLFSNYHHYLAAIAAYFPKGTKTSRPEGGLAIWVELDKRIDTMELYDLAIKHKISFAPGRMFTLQEQYEHCLRLCIGLPWSEELKFKLKTIGQLAKTLHPNLS